MLKNEVGNRFSNKKFNREKKQKKLCKIVLCLFVTL